MQARSFTPVLFLLAGLLGFPEGSWAQRIAEGFHYDPPTPAILEDAAARAKLVVWSQIARGGRTAELYFRNTSDQPIEITSIEFFACRNIMHVTCREKLKGRRLEPGQTAVLATVRQRSVEHRWSYRYRFQARFLPVDGSDSSPSAATSAGMPDANAANPGEHRRTTGWVPQRYAYIDQVMPILMRNHSVPGVAIVLVEGPNVQWSAGYGVARADASGSQAEVTARTVFRVGELGEPVIALAVHRLSEVRGWNVESAVATWAPREAIPGGLASVSAAQILAHAAPAEKASYRLLQHLIETSEGHDLEVLVRAMVLDPHHLTTMNFAPLASGGMASGHDSAGGVRPAAPVDDENDAGSLFSSAADYARFLIEASPLARRDPGTWRRLTEPRRELAPEFELASGLGWVVARAEDGTPIAFRVGTTPGYTSFALVDEVRERAAVILTNGDGGLPLIEQVLELLDTWSHPIVETYLAGPRLD